MKTLLNVGDVVKIRDDIERNKNYCMKLSGTYDSYIDDMLEPGKFATISGIRTMQKGGVCYTLKEDTLYNYTDEMFDSALIDFLYEEYLMNN